MSDQVPSSKPKFRFTIRSMLILTAVVAASGLSLNFYFRALYAEEGGSEIGKFAIVAAMTPTLFLIGVSWFLKIFGKWLR
jgi:hypothetical protein